MTRRNARLCAVALTAAFVFAAPTAFAAGLGDVSFELPDLASLWGRIASVWSGDTASQLDDIDTDLGLRDKVGGFTDPLGDDGGDTPPSTSTSTSTAPQSLTGSLAPGGVPTEP